MSTLNPILIDPGEFYLKLLMKLIDAHWPLNEIPDLTVGCIETLLESACSKEDLPPDFNKFLDQLEQWVDLKLNLSE